MEGETSGEMKHDNSISVRAGWRGERGERGRGERMEGSAVSPHGGLEGLRRSERLTGRRRGSKEKRGEEEEEEC